MNIFEKYNKQLAIDSAEFERLAPDYSTKEVVYCGGCSVIQTVVDIKKMKADYPNLHFPWWAEMYAPK